ncbi:hypothetical protein RYX36_007686 [Vicia faba]
MTRGIKHRQKAKSKTKKRSESSSSAPQVPVKVWQPGVDKLEEDEELQCDPSATKPKQHQQHLRPINTNCH